MKIINIPLEDHEWDKLMQIKGNKTWRDYLLKEVKQNDEGNTR